MLTDRRRRKKKKKEEEEERRKKLMQYKTLPRCAGRVISSRPYNSNFAHSFDFYFAKKYKCRWFLSGTSYDVNFQFTT